MRESEAGQADGDGHEVVEEQEGDDAPRLRGCSRHGRNGEIEVRGEPARRARGGEVGETEVPGGVVVARVGGAEEEEEGGEGARGGGGGALLQGARGEGAVRVQRGGEKEEADQAGEVQREAVEADVGLVGEEVRRGEQQRDGDERGADGVGEQEVREGREEGLEGEEEEERGWR